MDESQFRALLAVQEAGHGLVHGQVTPARFDAVAGLPLGKAEDTLDPYAQGLAAFWMEGRKRLRA